MRKLQLISSKAVKYATLLWSEEVSSMMDSPWTIMNKDAVLCCTQVRSWYVVRVGIDRMEFDRPVQLWSEVISQNVL